jgi:hypothetical protein
MLRPCARPQLDILCHHNAQVGGLCSITCSLVLPTAFYSLLAWKDLRLRTKTGLVALLLGAVALASLITLQNMADIIRHAHEQQGGSEHGGGVGALMSTALALLAPR